MVLILTVFSPSLGEKTKTKHPSFCPDGYQRILCFWNLISSSRTCSLHQAQHALGKKKNETPPTHTRPISYSVCRLPDSKHARCYVSGIQLTLTRLMMNNSNPLRYCQGFNSKHELMEPCKSQSGHFEALDSTRARKQRYHNLLFNHVEFIRATWLLIILYVLQSQ